MRPEWSGGSQSIDEKPLLASLSIYNNHSFATLEYSFSTKVLNNIVFVTIKDRVGLRASLMNIMLCHLRCDIHP